jgi:hypothetical protein
MVLILPCEANFLAHTGLVIATDLLGDHAVGLEVAAKVLTLRLAFIPEYLRSFLNLLLQSSR